MVVPCFLSDNYLFLLLVMVEFCQHSFQASFHFLYLSHLSHWRIKILSNLQTKPNVTKENHKLIATHVYKVYAYVKILFLTMFTWKTILSLRPTCLYICKCLHKPAYFRHLHHIFNTLVPIRHIYKSYITTWTQQAGCCTEDRMWIPMLLLINLGIR